MSAVRIDSTNVKLIGRVHIAEALSYRPLRIDADRLPGDLQDALDEEQHPLATPPAPPRNQRKPATP